MRSEKRYTPMKAAMAMLSLLVIVLACLGNGNVSLAYDYHQVPGLIDLRTTFSDGAHDLESLVNLAKKKGFHVVFINDHDRMVMEYGLPPFRNILKKRVELRSINQGGTDTYLNAIKEIGKKYPEMIIVPGTITAPFYYWRGSYFNKDLTAHNHERRILTIGLQTPEDYQELPIIHNGFSTRFVKQLMPLCVLFFIPLILSIVLLRWKGVFRVSGVVIGIISILCILNNHPFRSSPFDQYHGNQGIAPYQLLIDYVKERGGLSFWNYPETRSGIRKMGPIFARTTPYPEVLEEARGFTGFAAIYGDAITITEPGNIWDQVLLAYCKGKRDSPVWGISTADFHKEGENGEVLGNFPTVFFVPKKTKTAILEAMREGRMYACRGKYPHCARLDEFSIRSSSDEAKGISGDEIVVQGFPRIRIALSASLPMEKRVLVRLIRSGQIIERYEAELPLEIEHEDKDIRKGVKEYYRMDLKGYGTIVSNPIFVTSQQ